MAGTRRWTPTRPALLAAAIIVAHGLWILSAVGPVVLTPDAHGRFVQARLLAVTGHSGLAPASPAQFVDRDWREGPDGRYRPPEGPGMPLVLAAGYALGGPGGAVLVPVLLTALAFVALFLVAARWAGPWWAVLAVALAAASPGVSDAALRGDPQTGAACVVTWAVLLLVRWTEPAGRDTREISGLVFAAGILGGVLPAFSGADILYLPALLGFALLARTSPRPSWKGLATAIAGAVVPVAALALHNWFAYGALWVTGRNAPAVDGPGWLPLPLLCLCAIGSVAALRFWQRRAPRVGSAAATLCLAACLAIGLPSSSRLLAVHRDHANVLSGISDFLALRVPRGATLVTGVGVARQLDFVGGWKVADASLVVDDAGLLDAGGSRERGVSTRVGGRETPARHRHYAQARPGDRYRAFGSDVVAWAGPSDIYLLGKASDLRPWWNYLNRDDSFEYVAESPLPNEPPGLEDRPPPPPRPSLPSGRPAEPVGEREEPPPAAPHAPANRIADLSLDGRPLVLMHWTREQR